MDRWPYNQTDGGTDHNNPPAKYGRGWFDDSAYNTHYGCQNIIRQELVSGQSGLEEHLHCIWRKDHTRPNVECDPSARYS